ncbi:MAG: glycosyltransferase [Bacteroidota bacterium]
MEPVISVLMAVYNAEKYVAAAIESILNQSFKNFEFIILDDASTDSSKKIICGYQDERVRFIENKYNIGLTHSLNKGIALCKGRYIARMDADDISTPERLEKQVAFMETHPDIGVCGTWVYYLREDGKRNLWKYPEEDRTIRTELLLYNRLAHPSVILRRSIVINHQLHYNPEFYTSQDYDLWVRMSCYCKLANLSEPLVRYRHHNQSISHTKQRLQRRNTNQIRLYQLIKMGIQPSWRQWKLHLELIDQRPLRSVNALKETLKWLITLKKANQLTNVYTSENLHDFLTRQWHWSIHNTTTYNLKLLYLCLISPFPYVSSLSKSQLLRFLLACIEGAR